MGEDGAGHLDRAGGQLDHPGTTLHRAGDHFGRGHCRERPAKEDVPPEAVAGQFELSLGGNGGSGELCAGPFPPGPQVVPDRDQSA